MLIIVIAGGCLIIGCVLLFVFLSKKKKSISTGSIQP
jgi:hypothetical protein